MAAKGLSQRDYSIKSGDSQFGQVPGVEYFNGRPKLDIPVSDRNSNWIMAVLKDMYGQWNNWNGTDFTRRSYWRYYNNRLYAEGNQPVSIYKQMFDTVRRNGMIGTGLNLDYRPVALINKRVNILITKIEQMLGKIQATAVDAFAETERNKIKYTEMAKLVFGKEMNSMLASAGIEPMQNMNPEGPMSVEEIELYNEIGGYKLSYEIAIEKVIDQLFYLNDYPVIRRMVIRDLLCCGLGITMDYTDASGKICIERIKPEDALLFYSEYEDFRDLRMGGAFKHWTREELNMKSNGKFSNEVLNEIMTKFGGLCYDMGANGYSPNPYRWYNSINSEYKDRVVVLDGWFKTTMSITAKQTTGKFQYDSVRLVPDDEYNKGVKKEKTEESNTEYFAKNVEVVYRGFWIVGSDYIFSEGLMTDMPRQKSNMGKTPSPMHVYAPGLRDMMNKPMVELMIPLDDDYQRARIAKQSLMAKASPPIKYIGKSWMQTTSDGQGGVLTPDEAMIIAFQQGFVVLNDVDDVTGLPKTQNPIFGVENHQFSADVERLDNQMVQALIGINEATGLNPASDGSGIDPKTLVANAQMMQANTNFAISNLVEAIAHIDEDTASSVCGRLQIQARTRKNPSYEEAIGSFTYQLFGLSSDVYFHDMGIKIQRKMTAEEEMGLRAIVEKEITQGTLTAADWLMIKRCDNMKIAERMLILRLRKRKDLEQEMAMQNVQAQMESQAQATQQAAEMKMQEMQMQFQMKSQDEAMKHRFNMELEMVKSDNAIILIREQALSQQNISAQEKQAELQALREELANKRFIELQRFDTERYKANRSYQAQIESSKVRASKPSPAKKS